MITVIKEWKETINHCETTKIDRKELEEEELEEEELEEEELEDHHPQDYALLKQNLVISLTIIREHT